jgi:hypothetical protein
MNDGFFYYQIFAIAYRNYSAAASATTFKVIEAATSL